MGLTILTVGLSFVPSSPVMRIVAGQAIAVVKASLVVLFFMHALRSPRTDPGRDRGDRLLVRRGAVGIDVQRLFYAGNAPQFAGTLTIQSRESLP